MSSRPSWYFGSSMYLDDDIIIINPLTARVLGAPQMTLQPVFSIFPCPLGLTELQACPFPDVFPPCPPSTVPCKAVLFPVHQVWPKPSIKNLGCMEFQFNVNFGPPERPIASIYRQEIHMLVREFPSRVDFSTYQNAKYVLIVTDSQVRADGWNSFSKEISSADKRSI